MTYNLPMGHLPPTRNAISQKLFIWQVQVQSYNKSDKKRNILELYKYRQETEAKVQEYRYRQSDLVGQAVSCVYHRKRRWVLLVLISYARIKIHIRISKMFIEWLMGSMPSALWILLLLDVIFCISLNSHEYIIQLHNTIGSRYIEICRNSQQVYQIIALIWLRSYDNYSCNFRSESSIGH